MRPGRFGRYAIRTADGVQEAAYLPIGGIEQYIRVRGRSRANPVLLVLHGGPGSTLGATACRWQGALEAAFTVVHWDQRGSGNTYYRDPAAPPPTVERLLSDLDELVDALRARYGRDRLFLLGHSWGSLLGGLYALRRPEKLSAWLPVSQMVDFKRSEQVSAAEAIRRARGAGREEDAERLAQELEQVLALRRLDRAGAGALLRFRRRKERYLPPQYGGPAPLGGLAAPELTGNDLHIRAERPTGLPPRGDPGSLFICRGGVNPPRHRGFGSAKTLGRAGGAGASSALHLVGVQQNGHRSVVLRVHLHVCAELAVLHPETPPGALGHKFLIEGDGHRRLGGPGEAGAAGLGIGI